MKKHLLIMVLVMFLSIVLIGCDGLGGGGTTTDDSGLADPNKTYDTITKTLRLSSEYEGQSYIFNGIGKATVDAYTDGDTARFKLSETNEVITFRFYSVNTPESTGGVQKWGKAASLFTKDRLASASEIVLEAVEVGKPATKETYGRYLGYVWYKEAGDTYFKNLNLQIVENGYSENTGFNTSEYPYYSYFKKAQDFAQVNKLHVFASKSTVDPLYNEDPLEVSIKEFLATCNDVDCPYYNVESDSGSKIHFYGYVKDLKISNTGTYTFTIAQYDEDGKEYSMAMYTGYSNATGSKIKIGDYLNVVGVIQKYYGKFQLSGINYSTLYENVSLTYTVQKNYFLRFNSSLQESYFDNDGKALYSNLTVISSNVENGVLTIVGSAYQAAKDAFAEEATQFTITTNVPESYNNKFSAGQSITLSGLQQVADSGEIFVINYSTIK